MLYIRYTVKQTDVSLRMRKAEAKGNENEVVQYLRKSREPRHRARNRPALVRAPLPAAERRVVASGHVCAPRNSFVLGGSCCGTVAAMPAQANTSVVRNTRPLIAGPRLIGDLYAPVGLNRLVKVWPTGRRCAPGERPQGRVHLLLPDVADEFHEIHLAAKAAGFSVLIASGWRSEAHQTKLFEAAVARYDTPENIEKFGSAEKAARQWVAKQSEHATGKTIDFDVGIPIGSAFVEKFAPAASWQWLSRELKRRCWTPYPKEPWHWTRNPLPAPSLNPSVA